MSADLLARLIAAGTPADLVADVAMALAEANAAAAALERRRAGDRKRQAESRAARSAQSQNVTECHVTGCDITDEPAPSPPPPNPPQTPQTPPPPRPHPEGIPRARKAAAFPAPAGVTDEQWTGFVRQRRKPLTERAYALLGRKLAELAEAGWPPGDMIDLATERGWETVFAPKDHRNGSNGKPSGWLQH